MRLPGNVPDDHVWFGAVAFNINGDEWVLEKFLNYGGEGQTFSAVQKSSSKRFALKFCKQLDSREVELVKTMPNQLVEHPNLVKYKMLVLNCACQFRPAQHIIFMELVPNGDMYDFIDQLKSPVSNGTSRRFLHDVISGMAECYRSGLTHRDLKPENLLLDEQGRLVIIDMGHAKVTPEASQDRLPTPPPLVKNTTTRRYGTLEFNAPEQADAWAGKQYDCEASDVWAVGVIAFVLHARRFAFGHAQAKLPTNWSDISGADNEVFWQKIAKSGFYPEFPDKLKQFINALWRANPTERPSFGQLELAISGHVETISQFPGLQWLAQPTNDIDTFAAELRQCLPNIVLNIGKPNGSKKPNGSHLQEKSWLQRCCWCSA